MFRNVTPAVAPVAAVNNYLLPLWMIVFGVMLAPLARAYGVGGLKALDPLLPRDAGIDRDTPVEVEPAPRAGARVAGIGRQLEHVDMLSGDPMDHLLLFLGQRELDR